MKGGDIFARDNLVGWCFVYWDGNRRQPAERLEMLNRLGIRRVAYGSASWRNRCLSSPHRTLQQVLDLPLQHGVGLDPNRVVVAFGFQQGHQRRMGKGRIAPEELRDVVVAMPLDQRQQ